MNYQNRGLCYQITQTRGFDNSWYHAQPHPIIVYFSFIYFATLSTLQVSASSQYTRRGWRIQVKYERSYIWTAENDMKRWLIITVSKRVLVRNNSYACDLCPAYKFIFMQIRFICIWKVLLEDLFRKRVIRYFGNCLLNPPKNRHVDRYNWKWWKP